MRICSGVGDTAKTATQTPPKVEKGEGSRWQVRAAGLAGLALGGPCTALTRAAGPSFPFLASPWPVHRFQRVPAPARLPSAQVTPEPVEKSRHREFALVPRLLPWGALTKIPGSLFLGLLGENPGWVGGVEGRGGRVCMLLPKEFAEGALHRLALFHAAAGLSVPEGRTLPPSPCPAPD